MSSEILYKSFVSLCEKLITDAYVVTNGRSILTAVLDHDVATKLCQVMIDKSGQDWKVAKIPDALEMAYRDGYEDALKYMKENTDDIKEGPIHEED